MKVAYQAFRNLDSEKPPQDVLKPRDLTLVAEFGLGDFMLSIRSNRIRVCYVSASVTSTVGSEYVGRPQNRAKLLLHPDGVEGHRSEGRAVELAHDAEGLADLLLHADGIEGHGSKGRAGVELPHDPEGRTDLILHLGGVKGDRSESREGRRARA